MEINANFQEIKSTVMNYSLSNEFAYQLMNYGNFGRYWISKRIANLTTYLYVDLINTHSHKIEVIPPCVNGRIMSTLIALRYYLLVENWTAWDLRYSHNLHKSNINDLTLGSIATPSSVVGLNATLVKIEI